MFTKDKSNEIYITRLYNAPLKAVWDAWVDPNQAAHWWGPRGFTITTHDYDKKTGGFWKYTMHGPNGTDYANLTKYLEVEKYSHMIYDHGTKDGIDPMFRVTVYFTEVAGKTKMDMKMTLPTTEAAEQTKRFVKQAGGDATWDRLAEYLSKEEDIFVINRSFNAPIDVLFKVWTEPKHFSAWLAPTGFTMKFINDEIKVGNSTFYCMNGPNDMKMYGKAHYKEILKPNRLIYTQIFCDENENISRHPMAPTWPETMLTTVEFHEEENNQTRITVTWKVYGDATETERETFKNAKAGMTQGWTGSFDKLEDYLKNL